MKQTLLLFTTGVLLLGTGSWESLTQEGIALHRQGRYADAEQKFEEASVAAQAFDSNDARRWRTLHNLASVAYVRGDYMRARRLYTKLLSSHAPAPVERAKALSVMALLLRTAGQLEDAGKYAAEAAQILRIDAPKSKELANTYHIQSEIQRHRANYAEATRLISEAERILEGPDPLEGLLLQSRASILRDQGRASEAEAPQRQAFARLQQLCGPRHPLTITAMSNLGQILFTAGKIDEALPLMEHALDSWEAELGPTHPNVAAAANNLAQLYRSLNRAIDADPLYRKAISIWQQTLGPNHPDVAKGWKNLGDLFAQQGKLRGAQVLYERAHHILEQAYGPTHPLTLEMAANAKTPRPGGARKSALVDVNALR